MKILVVAPYVPYPPNFGGGARIYHLTRRAAERHHVSMICLCDVANYQHPNALAIKEFCDDLVLVPIGQNDSRGRSNLKRWQQLRASVSRRSFQYFCYHWPAMQSMLDQTLHENDYDVVQVEFPQMAYYRFDTKASLILDMHNIEHEIFYRTFVTENNLLRKFHNYLEWRKFRRDEMRLAAKFNALVVTSGRDGDVIQKALPNHLVAVVPNGVDTEYFTANPSTPEPHTLIFTGVIQYYPNTDAVLYFGRQILPLILEEIPDAKFMVVGNHPPKEVQKMASEHVIVTGGVPDVRPYFERSAAAVVPLRIGSGTRLKIAEAMSMSVPVVSTRIGSEGLEVQDDQDILIADDPPQFARRVIQLLKQPAKRAALAANGRRLVRAKYDWQISASKLDEIYQQVVTQDHAANRYLTTSATLATEANQPVNT